ncbi:MAG: hypothetical protein GXO80_04170 [Chlorobi bacterium]|nr:hypothetical protein [Chlorobiota bacterium]
MRNTIFKIFVIINLFMLTSTLYGQNQDTLVHFVKPIIENQKYHKIFVPFKKDEITIFNEKGQHLSGKFMSISGKYIFVKFMNDKSIYGFNLDSLSRISYKKGWGYFGGAITGLAVSTALSSMVLLDNNDGWQVLGFFILMLTVVPAVTFLSGGATAIFSERINIKMHSSKKEKKILKLKRFERIQINNIDSFEFKKANFYPIN